MNFKRLETFVWVATLGSFRKAAERQYTTQPAISSRIQALEEELGVKLFERDGGPGPVALTAKGKELLPYAEKLIFMADQFQQRANQAAAFAGNLRLGVSETIVHTWLPDFLKQLHQEFPELDVEITVDVTSTLRAALLEHSLDLAFLMGPISAPGISNFDLSTFPLEWVASPELNLPERTLQLEELVKWPIITYARNTRPYAEINQKFRELDDQPARFFSSSSLAACRRLTLDGVGISTLPQVLVADELQSGSLKRLSAVWTPSALHFTASYRSDPYNPIAEVATERAVAQATQFALQAALPVPAASQTGR
ncbi:LysR family transcriptional regulator [Pokkaliibacter plantistimulans]|uniref:LysR family transcriptional regulator n=2 Tax=Pseudomonadota TaxID=1224 RepID=A0A2S5KSQ7_9PROT|nr:LysR family transcriptional regulator [Pokkaliibacter plantistimulans]PPC77559.1 LysR family transcriptional regulator [Pokkaliibacter plantistimulans]